jgi:sugar lactone lactonase YvrE/thiol-disulfide isomerase/thioredoxin
MESFVGRIHAPEFPADLDWLNCEQPLEMKRLRGKVVLFEFWTFCCINCHHNIDQVRQLQQRFGDALVVIGVHSAKFAAEKETAAIRQAVLRHEVDYPVVNDHRFEIWQAYCVRAWPTLILVDPEGCLKAQHSGEIQAEQVGPLIERMVEHFSRRGLLDRTPLERRGEEQPSETTLRFPSKVLASMDGHLFVADTGHHRLLEIALDAERRRGRIRRVFGRGEPGLGDGPYRQASFHSPHGIARWGSRLYVADTGNHAIRQIDLIGGEVKTLAGTGKKAQRLGLAGKPAETALRSPWDICCHRHGQVFIAMAGSHQIYSLSTGEAVLPGDPPGEPRLEVFAGTGTEALVDDLRIRASFNQPSGLAASRNHLFVADAEASAIRVVPVAAEQGGNESRVETLIGTGLFDFGDADGAGLEVLLQHPTGIAHFDGWIYIADTFNHKIKRLDPATRETRSLFGDGTSGWADGSFDEVKLAEPEGLSFEPGRRRIYVADTSNHTIRVADLDARQLWTLEIEG